VPVLMVGRPLKQAGRLGAAINFVYYKEKKI